MSAIETISESRCFGGMQGFYRHESTACNGAMRFAVFVPPQAAQGNVPVLYYLSGLTCTEENFTVKAGAQRVAAELGLMLVVPDTSPRNTGIAGEADDEHFGAGAGFYLDATQAPWSRHFNMYSYVTQELPALIGANFAADLRREGIFGHSMGGHGALTIALKNPSRYSSLSAFAPISAPMRAEWPQRAFARYLGEDRETWKPYDATELLKQQTFPGTILVDQGDADPLIGGLRPDLLEEACKAARQPLSLRMQRGYNHNYFFVSTFVEDHLRHHAAALAS
ncbi:MAG: S-formylglutathione hydrolase [Rudaea sp.]|uniref:S-formylglutathione hydrolase n=1 Tax=Rudaea sp. TaxID=2136325 RepID=UPI0039E34443